MDKGEEGYGYGREGRAEVGTVQCTSAFDLWMYAIIVCHWLNTAQAVYQCRHPHPAKELQAVILPAPFLSLCTAGCGRHNMKDATGNFGWENCPKCNHLDTPHKNSNGLQQSKMEGNGN